MKHLILLQLLFLTSFSAFCQHETSSLKSSQLKANLVLLGASASYETRISNKVTLNFEASLNYGFIYSNSSMLGSNFGYNLAPSLSVEGRRYYNLDKRISKGRSTLNNSGNFLALQLEYQFPPLAYHNVYANPFIGITPLWGMQRRVGKRFSFEALFGIGGLYDTRVKAWDASLAIGIKFGYVIF